MKRICYGAIAAAGLVLAACSSTPEPPPTAPQDIIPELGLPPQTLEIGECGIFLWQVSGEPTFMFFGKAAEDTAKMLIGDTPRPLALEAAGGDIFGQFNTEQTWASPETGHRINLRVVPGEALIDGQQVPSGRISITDSEGWETIIPVSGVTACMERPDPSVTRSRG